MRRPSPITAAAREFAVEPDAYLLDVACNPETPATDRAAVKRVLYARLVLEWDAHTRRVSGQSYRVAYSPRKVRAAVNDRIAQHARAAS